MIKITYNLFFNAIDRHFLQIRLFVVCCAGPIYLVWERT